MKSIQYQQGYTAATQDMIEYCRVEAERTKDRRTKKIILTFRTYLELGYGHSTLPEKGAPADVKDLLDREA